MTTRNTSERSQVQLASGINILAGIWLALAPWFLAYASGVGIWSSIIVGIIIAVLAGIRAFGAYDAAWMSWANVVLGLWVIIAPFILGYGTYPARLWNNIIVGVIVAALGTWSAVASNRAHRSA